MLLDHLRARRLLGAYADRELDLRTSRRVREHLRECWVCSGQLELWCLVRAALRQRRRAEPPELPVQRLVRLARRIAAD